LTFRIEFAGEEYTLDLQRNGSHSEYQLRGSVAASGTASVAEVMPGIFSILIGDRHFTVCVAPNGDEIETWAAGEKRVMSIGDARDRSSKNKRINIAGPMEVRAQMPGKVIKLLVQQGDAVEAGQGLITVEAMKMQNEMKSPKKGVISKVRAVEGATVAAGEALIVVE
jgi:biotin carboxyl carrier protein